MVDCLTCIAVIENKSFENGGHIHVRGSINYFVNFLYQTSNAKRLSQRTSKVAKTI